MSKVEKLVERFFNSNDTMYRVERTIVQGIIGCITANLDLITGLFSINPAFKPLIASLVMSILSPIMSEIGKKMEVKYESD